MFVLFLLLLSVATRPGVLPTTPLCTAFYHPVCPVDFVVWVGPDIGIEYRLYVNAIARYVKTNSFPCRKTGKYLPIRMEILRDPDVKTTRLRHQNPHTYIP